MNVDDFPSILHYYINNNHQLYIFSFLGENAKTKTEKLSFFHQKNENDVNLMIIVDIIIQNQWFQRSVCSECTKLKKYVFNIFSLFCQFVHVEQTER